MSRQFESVMLHMEEEDDEEAYRHFLGLAAIEEEQQNINRHTSRHRGSVQGRITIDRGRHECHNRLFRDYFAEHLTYPPYLFRRRFRMRRPLFLRIQQAVEAYDSYFVQKMNVAGKLGLSSLQKIIALMRMLAYDVSADLVDDYMRIGESTTILSLKRFVKAVIAIFGDEYLRSPNSDDIVRLLSKAEERGFPGMLGSIDCMHWKWKNCLVAWHGMYSGHVHEPIIILEAMASYDLWIWHAYFGLPDSHNDINVLERSSIFSALTEGCAPAVNYSINGHEYTMGYYLADGIYPPWATFVKTISALQGNKRKLFAKTQKALRKDVERAFGVLQARFAIICGPARFWDQTTLKDIMTASIILHNMIIEDEQDENQEPITYDTHDEIPTVEVSYERTPQLLEFIEANHRIGDRQVNSQLQQDIIQHLWSLHGGA